MNQGEVIGYVLASVLVVAGCGFWFGYCADERKPLWPPITAAVVWFAPALFRLWFSMVLS